MTKHLFGAVVTSHGVAANNRGETEGNTTTLQKILWNGDVHSTVSAEAIRWAIRADWQRRGLTLNREWHEDARSHDWRDRGFSQGPKPYIDDDVLGYMAAEAGKEDGSGADSGTKGKGRTRGTVLVRRSRFEATRAVSLSPWTGDVIFNVAGIGATPSASKSGQDPVPYSAEVHATRYQYAFALTPDELHDRARAHTLIDAIIDLAEVAGNHARYLYDFSPDAVLFRWTDDAAPRILYAFQMDEAGQLMIPNVLRRVRAGDIDAQELIIGGSLASSQDAEELKGLGASVHSGVKKAAEAVRERLTQSSGP
jgi:CRISPR-associated protein Cst2